MHARHRSPGNGYRSGSMGMSGVATSSRISPEGSMKGRGFYNPEYRSYNRGGFNRGGYGRGMSKPFQLPQASPRKGDIFMEAGRLATEYLVSKGLLPSNVLSEKWQNGSLKNQVEEFQGFRAQIGDNLQLPPEGRTSALARLGDAVPDAGPGRRRFPDEYSLGGSRNYMRGRRRSGSFRSYGSDWNQEFGRNGSWSNRARASPDVEGNDDAFSVSQEEQPDGKDGGSEVQKSLPNELATKNDSLVDSESHLEKDQLPGDVGSKASSSSVGKDLPLEADSKPIEKSNDTKTSNSDTGEFKDDSSNVEKEKQSVTQDTPMQRCAEENEFESKNGSDLLGLCRFAKVPTRTRSSLAIRGSKADPVSIYEDGNSLDNGLPRESEIPVKDIPLDGFSGDAPSAQSPKCLESDVSKAPAADEAGELGLVFAVGQGKCTKPGSFSERFFMNEQESKEELPGLGNSSSMVVERGEKRPVQDDNTREGTKKPREWTPSMDSEAGDYLHLPSLMEKHQTSQEEMTSSGEEIILATDQDRLLDMSLFQKSDAQPRIEYLEEKELLPGSFKICDLNLMEASDVNENQDPDLLIFPSNPERKREVTPLDVDLSMSSKCNTSDKCGRHGADGKEVEVIDLENDSLQEDNAFHNTERKAEAVFTGLDSFPNQTPNVDDIPDVQDGYGLMISELLGNDIPNCSSVQSGISSLHNEMGLHNGEGILGDDDSIYMSLGEIPISFLQVWEQQTQEYGKPF